MPEFKPVVTAQDFYLLDPDDIAGGYVAGYRGDAKPDQTFSRAFHHGYESGRSDRLRKKKTKNQRLLYRSLTAAPYSFRWH